jgi:tRNA(fMet)-specific endonuclease VapC
MSRHRTALQNWLRAFLVHADVLLPDRATLEFYADVRVHLKIHGTPIPANDCWIAALARQHLMPIVSRDTRFDLVPDVRRLSW